MKQKIELSYGNTCGDPQIHHLKSGRGSGDGWYLVFDWDGFDLTMFFSEKEWLQELADKINEGLRGSEQSTMEAEK